MAFNLAAADAILKQDYLPPVREQLNQATPVLAELDKNTKDVVGKEAVVPLHISRGESIGARSEVVGNDALPAANAQGYVQSKFFVKYQYGRIQVSLPTIEATKSDKGAFIRAIDSETKGALRDLKEDFDRQLVKNDALGRGILGICTAQAGVNALVLSGTDATTFRALRVGMYIDIVNVTNDAVLASNRLVTAINTGTNTVTISGAVVTTTVDHRLVRTGNWKNELRGYPGVLSTTEVLQGIDPAVVSEWKAAVSSAGGATISDDLLQQLVDSIDVQSGEEPDAFLVEQTQRRKYVNTLLPIKRFNNTLELKGGHKTITFNDSIPFLVDRFWSPSQVGAIARKHQALYELADWKWADNDGHVLRNVAGYPSFEAFLYKFADLGVDRRNAFGLLTNLSTA